MAPVLEARDLDKLFGAVVAASEINVAVDEGEVVGIIGANGAGKTTFVNIVTGYLKPTHGRVYFEGRDITALSPRAITRLGVSRSFQIPQLFGELTVLDNALVALGESPRMKPSFWQPLARSETVALAVETLAQYGIGEYRDRRASTLPQGVRKLLDIAMAMTSEPRLVLLDEPTSGISVEEKFATMDTLMAALRGQGVTVLFVEHDMEIVERYGERVMAFADGRIIADDAPAKVFADATVQAHVVGTAARLAG